MKLPYGDQALVEESKLTRYLLSLAHEHGRYKARFFIRLGFHPDDPEVLRQALLGLALESDVEEVRSTYGRKFVGRGVLQSPQGRQATVVTVWILRNGVPPPILVTAYPG